jgi:hypothetical protein
VETHVHTVSAAVAQVRRTGCADEIAAACARFITDGDLAKRVIASSYEHQWLTEKLVVAPNPRQRLERLDAEIIEIATRFEVCKSVVSPSVNY